MKNYNSTFTILDKEISMTAPTYFIADIAANHDNDLERAKDLIYLCAESGANAAKFQHFQAKTIVSDAGFKQLGSQLSHQQKWKDSVFETYEKASLNIEWTETLKETCEKAGIHFFTSPYAIDIVDKISPLVPAYKVGSGDITFTQIIEHMSKQNKPILLAAGASTMEDVERAVQAVLKHNPNIALMQCNTNYTGSLENFKYINLRVLETFKQKYPDMLLGLSDHTPGHTTVLGAVAMGARIIEKHFTDDTSRIGPDHAFSMTPITWKDMVDRTRELEAALGNGIKIIEENEKDTIVVQRRCLRLTRDMNKGEILSEQDLVALRPAPIGSCEPYELENIIGKPLKVSLKKDDPLMRITI